MEVLLLQADQEEREKLVFFIESTYSSVVHEASSLENALEIVRRANPPMDLVILMGAHGSEEELKSFSTEILEIPSLFVLDEAWREKAAGWGGTFISVEHEKSIEAIVTAIDELVERGVLHIQKSEAGQCRIRTRLLLSVCPLKGDVYIRLNSDKFVKLFREGDVFEYADMEKYTVNKGVEYLYIRREQCREFTQKLIVELETVLKTGKLSIEGTTKLTESVHEAVQELISNVGFTKEVQELVKTQVQIAMKALGKEPNLADLMRKFQSMEGLYISSHSTLCALLACGLAVELQWGSAPTFYKLTLAAFLHDITLSNHELAALKGIDELDAAKDQFTAQEQKEYREHPIKASEMTRKMTEVPPDVDTIIRQHHERPDGTGFPGGLEHKYIAPLSSLFIVAHDLADYAIEAKMNFNIETFLQTAREVYKASYFRKILVALEVLRKF